MQLILIFYLDLIVIAVIEGFINYVVFLKLLNHGIFSVCAPPSLVGAYYLQPPDARAIFLHDDLLCNGTCSVTGGSITNWGGGTNGKDPYHVITVCHNIISLFLLMKKGC